MPLVMPVAKVNSIVDHAASLGSTFSLHTGNPGPNMTANEASGGGYARQTAPYPAAALGKATTPEMIFNVDAATYTHMVRWNGTDPVEVIDNPDITISPAGEAKVTHTLELPYVLPA